MKIDIIGDIHGCFDEFYRLTCKLGYQWDNGLPAHPEQRKLGFVGDLTDRGPQSLKVVEVVWQLVVNHNDAYYVPGNHCDKLYRFFKGNNVKIVHGLETTAAEYERLSPSEKQGISSKFRELYEKAPLYQVLDDGKLIIAHAGIRQDLIGKVNSKVKTFVLYGDITGQTNPDGTPVRRDWAKNYQGDALIVYGHTPVKQARIVNNTYNIDTGAVFGGELTCLRYPEKTLFSVPSTMPCLPEKFRDIN
ncbi:bis(5'-nucleosyl)-tetraphosphatase PrpE [Peribacillus deserti]|uniref:Calcineurin-like phosphoesterase domain-containing protein n=1 Tax=Peribacillus deserti TaxID=673318 RepID=A0A2N5M7Q1_9BACI|nr:bis(5'-nucleosyl)-tetraphosphatase PrpE [Peribacillus deserti]PLT30362.1 hypothetical protein CUU66_07780 [Peribacillus deserti]